MLRELAARLSETSESDQGALLHDCPRSGLSQLAFELKTLCYDAWAADPDRTRRVLSAIILTASLSDDPDLSPLAEWAHGISAMLDARMTAAIDHFESARIGYEDRGLRLDAAETSIGAIYALAMLGRYDDAIATAAAAREVFLELGDLLAAAKIEHNLGNLYQRRDRYHEAEAALRSARTRYFESGETVRRIQTDNSLANALAHQYRFEEAIEIYESALADAERESLERTSAEIESNLGHLLLFQGRFDRALVFFERSRVRYESLSMPHQSAIADQEIADAYLELNLFPEAEATYRRVLNEFADLGLRAEHARVLVGLSRSLIAQGSRELARETITDAIMFYNSEGNAVGLAVAALSESQILLLDERFQEASDKAAKAAKALETAGFLGRALEAWWLSGEAERLAGNRFEAHAILTATLDRAAARSLPQIQLNCLTSLGLLATSANKGDAERYFRSAIAVIELIREPLPAEDLRTAFITDKMAAFTGLIGILVDSNERLEEALEFSEMARSRVLREMIGTPERTIARSTEGENHLRRKLNWLYERQNEYLLGGANDPIAASAVDREIATVEMAVLDQRRRLEIQREPESSGHGVGFSADVLRRNLGADNVLLEYVLIDGDYGAFVVTEQEIGFVARLGNESSVNRDIDLIHSAARAGRVDLVRLRSSLERLYDSLYRPLEDLIGSRRPVIVPYGGLHYVPFAALHDGLGYLIEWTEIAYAPSAAVFNHCVAGGRPMPKNPVFVGVPDEFAPRIEDEVDQLAGIFPHSRKLLGSAANLENVIAETRRSDLVHFACHGRFRHDNPLFSSLRLADGWFNVRDAYQLELERALVVLSACETGLSAVRGGEELFGLTRGFLLSGATSIVTSLWPVDDSATVGLMARFYSGIRSGEPPGVALRAAQLELLAEDPDPLVWSPWVIIGAS